MNTIDFSFRKFAALSAGGLLFAGSVLSAAGNASAEAQARYRQEMAVCNSGQSHQDAATCRTEARNALAEARRGGLTDAPATQYQANATQRCGLLQGDDRGACMARMRGEGRSDGSVTGGGILRESVTVVPAK